MYVDARVCMNDNLYELYDVFSAITSVSNPTMFNVPSFSINVVLTLSITNSNYQYLEHFILKHDLVNTNEPRLIDRKLLPDQMEG